MRFLLLTFALTCTLLTTQAGPGSPLDTPFQPTLSSFTAVGEGQHVSLAWSVVRSAKVAFVIVQRRVAGPASWEAVAHRPVTKAISYRLDHPSLGPGTYRLVTVDQEGMPAFSRTITIQ